MTRHKHSLAYCFVTYISEDGQRESLWNSRDGAVPIEIPSLSGELMMVEPEPDRIRPDYRPQHTPAVGDRIFVDLTELRARILAAERVDRWEDHERGPFGKLGLPALQDMFESREAAIESAFESLYEPDAPDILIVTRGYLADLEQGRMRDSTIAGGREVFRETEASASPLFESEVKRISKELKRTSVLDFYDRDLNPIDYARWMELFNAPDYATIARTTIEDVVVSTIWTGVDSSIGRSRYVFETHVLADWVPSEERSLRYCSLDAAKFGHAATVETITQLLAQRDLLKS